MKLVIICVVLMFGYICAEPCEHHDTSKCTGSCLAGYSMSCINHVCSCAQRVDKVCTTKADCTGICTDPNSPNEHCFDSRCHCSHHH